MRLYLILSLIGLGACATEVARSNPNDPDGTGPKNPGYISGTVVIVGVVDQAGVTVVITGENGAIADEPVTAVSGEFISAELSPGLYDLSVLVPAQNLPVEVADVAVLPAVTTELGTLVSPERPLSGAITGTVRVTEPGTLAGGIRVIASQDRGAEHRTWLAHTDATGAFGFAGLPLGGLELRIEQDGLTPSWREIALDVDTPARDAGEVELHSAELAVRFVVDTGAGEVVAAPFTRETGVELALLSFSGVNEYRVSTSPDFVEGTEVAWQVYADRINHTLVAAEGSQTVFAQYRIVDGSGAERFRTNSFSASIVLDQTPPELVGFEVAPDAPVIDGVRYLATDPGDTFVTIPYVVEAFDQRAPITGLQTVLPGEDPGLVEFTNLTVGQQLFFSGDATVANQDGDVIIRAAFRDAAGNVSALHQSMVRVDGNPPELLATPAVVAVDAEDPNNPSPLHTQMVTLAFHVGGTDGPATMQFGVGDPQEGEVWLPYQPTATLETTAAHASTVKFFGIFRDRAGNTVSATSPLYTLDLEGSVSGRVVLEGVDATTGDHSVAAAALLNPGTGAVATTTPVAVGGDYTLTALDGTYLLRLTAPSYQTYTSPVPVTVTAGQALTLGDVALSFERAPLAGTFRYGDLAPAANHANIRVVVRRKLAASDTAYAIESVALTDATGLVSFPALPVTTTASPRYEVTASTEGYLDRAIPGVEVLPETDNLILDNTPQVLLKLAGDFKLCSETEFDASGETEPRNCASKAYTNEDTVLLGLLADPAAFPFVRYTLDTTGTPNVDSFADPSATPASDACGGAPQAECWNDFVQTSKYLAAIASVGQDVATVVVQFAADTADNGQPVGVAQIIRDTQPPYNIDLEISQGDDALLEQHTRSPLLAVAFSADAATGPEQAAPVDVVMLSEDATWGDADDETVPFAAATGTFSLENTGDGGKILRARFCDLAGNCTAAGDAVTATIVLDRTAPDHAGITILPTGLGVTVKDAGARKWWTRSTVYGLAVTLGDAGRQITIEGSPYDVPEIGALRVSRSQQFIGASWHLIDLAAQGAGAAVTVIGTDLEPSQGEQTLYVELMDVAGNVLGDVVETRFILDYDTVPPSGSVSFASSFTDTAAPTTIIAELTADAEVTEIQSTNASGWDGILPDPYLDARQAFVANLPVAVPAGEGEKKLQIRFFDPAGNFAEREARIVLDVTDPAGVSASCVTCGSDASGNLYLLGDGSLTLALTATDTWGIASIDIRVNGALVENRAFAPSVSATIPADQGSHTVGVRFYDPAGNITDATTLTIQHDNVTPSGCSLSIRGTAADDQVSTTLTGTRAVELLPSCSAVDEMMLSNFSGFVGAAWQPYSAGPVPWSLEPGDSATKTVYVRFRDWAGNELTGVTGTIELDTTAPAPPTITIEGGDEYVDAAAPNHTVNLSVTSAGADEMRLDGADGTFDAGDAWIGVGAGTINLPTGDGRKVVRAMVRDLAGNMADFVAQDDVILDTTAPVVLDVIVGDDSGYVRSGTVNVAVHCFDAQAGDAELTLEIEDESANSLYDAGFVDLLSVGLAGSQSSGRSLTAFCTNPAGKVGSRTSATFAWDGLAPTVPTFALSGSGCTAGTHTSSRTIDVSLTVDDNVTGVDAVALSESDSACSTATFDILPPFTGLTHTLSDTDGSHTLYVCARDAAGNFTAAAVGSSNSLTLDTNGPTVPGISRTGISNEQISVYWTTPTDPSGLDGFVLERRLDGESLFSVLDDTLQETDTALVDTGVPTNIGLRHHYRIYALDTCGNASSYSLVLDAGVPIDPVTATLLETPVAGERVVAWTRPPGTFLSTGSYTWEEGGILHSEAVSANATSFYLPSGSGRLNETLWVFNSNNDGSLTWENQFWFGTQRRAADSDDHVGQYAALAVDDANRAHVVYYDNTNGTIEYMRLDGAWEPVTVVAGSGAGLGLAVGPDGVPKVVYDSGGGGLMHLALDAACLANPPAACVPQRISPTGVNSEGEITIGVGSDNVSHVAYADWDTGTVSYARVDAGCVASPNTCPDIIDNDGVPEQVYPSLAVDSNNVAHISYRAVDGSPSATLRYAVLNSACLASPPATCAPYRYNVDIATGEGAVSIALDVNDEAHLAFGSSSPGDLYYMHVDATCLSNAPFSCTAEVIDSTVNTRYPSIAIGPDGVPYIAYQDVTTSTLKGVRVQAPYTPETLDDTGHMGSHCNMAFDRTGARHITHFDGSNFNVRYHFTPGSGSTQTVDDSSTNVGAYVSIGVGADGTAHLAYHEQSGWDLRYLKVDPTCLSNPPASCAPVDIDNATNQRGYHPSLAVDSAGIAHIASVDITVDHLRYVKADATCLTAPPATCSHVVLTEDGLADYETQMVLDGSDVPHIGYARFAGSVHYVVADATCLGNPPFACNSLTVDDSGSVGQSLDMDLLGASPHFAYFDVAARQPLYLDADAACLADAPASCVSQQIEPGRPNVGNKVAMVLDSTGVAHVAYYDADHRDVRYTKLDGQGVHVLLDGPGSVGQAVDIAIDSYDVAHVAYWDANTANLKYVRVDGVNHPVTVDDDEDVGRWLAITIDRGDIPHIGYYSFHTSAPEHLKYARGPFAVALPRR